MKTIKALIMDVDGTLTDGGLYIGKDGELAKKFCVRDGYAIHDMLPAMGIRPIIITGRKSEIVQRRSEELGISLVIQGSTNKVKDMQKILREENIDLCETAYIGDDLNDLACMLKVGVKGCPGDAVKEIKNIADFVAKCDGGKGAVREFIDWLKTDRELGGYEE